MIRTNELSEETKAILTHTAQLLRDRWAQLVAFVDACPPEYYEPSCQALAHTAKVGVDSLKRYVQAILHAHSLGYSSAEIIEAGQEKTLGDFAKSRRQERYSDTVRMQFEVPGFLRELVQQDFARIKVALSIATSEDVFDFLHSVFENMTDEEIRHLAQGKE